MWQESPSKVIFQTRVVDRDVLAITKAAIECCTMTRFAGMSEQYSGDSDEDTHAFTMQASFLHPMFNELVNFKSDLFQEGHKANHALSVVLVGEHSIRFLNQMFCK